MSKLIDKLTKSRQAEPLPMGFMLGKTTPEKARIQLVAMVTAEVRENCAQEIAEADAIILDIGKADDYANLEKAAQNKDGLTVGVRLKTYSTGTIKKIINACPDFIFFSIQAPFSLIKDEKLGKILELESSMDDMFLRGCSDLPVDAVMVLEKDVAEVLTLNRLMDIRRMLYSLNKPVLVKVPLSFETDDFQALYDSGISGVVVDVADARAAGKLAGLRQAIAKLKKTAPKKDKVRVVVPKLQPEAPQVEEEEEEEDE